MGLTGFIRGSFAVLCGIIGMYILEIAFPANQLYQKFHNLIPTLPMSAEWKITAMTTLGGWVWYDRAFVICIIAIFVWLFSLIFIDVDYGKQRIG